MGMLLGRPPGGPPSAFCRHAAVVMVPEQLRQQPLAQHGIPGWQHDRKLCVAACRGTQWTW